MKEIQLNTTYKSLPNYLKHKAIVDDEDYDMLRNYKWSFACERYAKANIDGKPTLMHNFIMGAKGVDHIDGNGLNNQRVNLRVASQSQNTKNMRPQIGRSSKYKGVSKKRGKWRAYITCNYERTHLGTFVSEIDAALAYNSKAKELFGEFANLNIIQ